MFESGFKKTDLPAMAVPNQVEICEMKENNKDDLINFKSAYTILPMNAPKMTRYAFLLSSFKYAWLTTFTISKDSVIRIEIVPLTPTKRDTGKSVRLARSAESVNVWS